VDCQSATFETPIEPIQADMVTIMVCPDGSDGKQSRHLICPFVESSSGGIRTREWVKLMSEKQLPPHNAH
jgi:hypothetical protein